MTQLLVEEAADGVIRRTFAAELSAGDGRTVDVRIVPYGEQIQHNDGLGGRPKGQPYTEEWAPGAFSHQERAANRVLANVEHEEGIRGVVGHGTALLERSDGLYGSFKIHETPQGDTTLILVREGVLDSVSLEAVPVKSVQTRDGVIRRVKGNLKAVAFARFGAYSGSQVLAVREPARITEEIPAEWLPAELDPEVVERCRALGLELPDRYKAHPDTGTPAETGTPEDDGTRQAATSSTEEKPDEKLTERT